MAKPVGSHCNLRCGYCYYLDTPAPQPRMYDETLARFISAYIAANPGPEISFVWHGGEPTLAGIDFYRRVVELQKHLLPDGWTCWNNLQTNGVLLDDDWCQFLADAQFDVGLSIDGTQWIHDEYRPDPRGNGSYQAAAAAITRLQAHGIQPDLLCTVTSTTAGNALEVYRSLRAFDAGWMQFIPIVRRNDAGDGVTSDSVTGRQYGEFLNTVFDEWVLHDLDRVGVQLFAETLGTLSGGAPGLCWLAPTCGRALVVEADGGVYSCDHFVTSSHRLGDVATSALGTLADSPTQVAFGDAKRDTLPRQCLECPWLTLCNGGCPKDRFASTPSGEPGLNHLCEGLTAFFAHAVPDLIKVVQMTGRGDSPAEIMDALRVDRMAMWAGVGRNDPCPCGSGRKAKQCCWAKRPKVLPSAG